MKIQHIIDALEVAAPPKLQESYDNTGFQTGDPDAEATGALLCVDVSEEVIDEAVQKNCNLIITHHPLLFRGLKRVTGRTRPERVLAAAIRNGITIYSCHTAIDSAPGGVSIAMANRLGLKDIEVLAPPVPGAGYGLGAVGNLPEPLSQEEFLSHVKKTFGCQVLRVSRSPQVTSIRRVAMCGGAGAEFLPDAIAAGAQAYITADCKLNEFLDYRHGILLVDAGHFETEMCTKEIFFDIISKNFPTFAVSYAHKDLNPIIYL